MAKASANRKFWAFDLDDDDAPLAWDLFDWAVLATSTASIPAPTGVTIPLAGDAELSRAALSSDHAVGSSDFLLFPDTGGSQPTGGGTSGDFDLLGSALLPADEFGTGIDDAISFASFAPDADELGSELPDDDADVPTGTILEPSSFYVVSTNGYQAFDICTINTFVDENQVRHDTITNFRPGLTLLQLDDAKFSSGAEVLAHAQQIGSDTVITVDGSYEIILQSVALASLNTASFLLV